jgi:NAD(P)-dependent dehydrogenase (short-subunit alcohol dehydrogenase family)
VNVAPEPHLSSQVALVTGAAGGIGRATALALARAGADVAIVDVNEAGLEQTAAAVASFGRKALSRRLDLSDIPELPLLVADVVAQLGRIDILINAAGIASRKYVLEVDEEEWDRVQTINLKAPAFLLQAVARHMVERGGGGKVVNVSSSSAFRTRGAPPAYATSKAAIHHLSRVAAAELAPHNVNVNTVVPGVVVTPMIRESFGTDEEIARRVNEGPLANLFGRPSLPEDVADAILFLCLPASRQITAQAIHISAGAVI